MTNTWKEGTIEACKRKILGSTDAISVPWTGVDE